LHVAAFSEVKSLEVARYLLENGAKSSAQVHGYGDAGALCRIRSRARACPHCQVVCMQDEDGWTALHFAATKGRVDLVHLLILSRADNAI